MPIYVEFQMLQQQLVAELSYISDCKTIPFVVFVYNHAMHNGNIGGKWMLGQVFLICLRVDFCQLNCCELGHIVTEHEKLLQVLICMFYLLNSTLH
jgi:hypothetical protein